jgi:hypothetical protein
MSYPPLEVLRASLDEEPYQSGVLQNTIDALLAHQDVSDPQKEVLRVLRRSVTNSPTAARLREVQSFLVSLIAELPGQGAPLRRSLPGDIPPRQLNFDGGRKRSQTKRFGSCVKAVRKTVKARKGSNPESAAIAICTKSILFPRGRTIKRYRKGRLLTQKRK